MFRKSFTLAAAAFAVAGTLAAFEVTPRIYPADTEATITFRPTSKWEQENLKKFRVAYVSGGGFHADGSGPHPGLQPIKAKVGEDGITVTVKLRGEDRHAFRFSLPAPKGKKGPMKIEYLLTLKPDLFALRPFRGNVHQHSEVSDGKLPPEEHIRWARHAGFDFVGVSDHGKYEQNPRVIRAAAESGSALTVYPAQEMHTPGAVLHSVCVGAPSVMLFKLDDPADVEGAGKVAAEIRREYPSESAENILMVAQAVYLARRARAAGATLIYAHPFWVPGMKGKLQSPLFMTRYILRHKDFDAVEICNGTLGGAMNDRIGAFLYEEAAATGRRWPVVSSSDCHNVAGDGYRRNFNVFFAKDCTYASFRDALIDFRTAAGYLTASAGKKGGDGPVAYFGTSRIVDYALFLHDCGYWARHLVLCRKQEALLAKYLAGDKSVVPEIRKLAEEIGALRESLYFRAK